MVRLAKGGYLPPSCRNTLQFTNLRQLDKRKPILLRKALANFQAESPLFTVMCLPPRSGGGGGGTKHEARSFRLKNLLPEPPEESRGAAPISMCAFL